MMTGKITITILLLVVTSYFYLRFTGWNKGLTIKGWLVFMTIWFAGGTGSVIKHECPEPQIKTLPGKPLDSPELSFDDLLNAIEEVESGGNTDAIGDNGDAVGSFQIHKSYVDDVNLIIGRKIFNYEDRLDRLLSREMVSIYLWHYGRISFESMARCHNGGPNGWEKDYTKQYWEKVKKCLKPSK